MEGKIIGKDPQGNRRQIFVGYSAITSLQTELAQTIGKAPAAIAIAYGAFDSVHRFTWSFTWINPWILFSSSSEYKTWCICKFWDLPATKLDQGSRTSEVWGPTREKIYRFRIEYRLRDCSQDSLDFLVAKHVCLLQYRVEFNRGKKFRAPVGNDSAEPSGFESDRIANDLILRKGWGERLST